MSESTACCTRCSNQDARGPKGGVLERAKQMLDEDMDDAIWLQDFPGKRQIEIWGAQGAHVQHISASNFASKSFHCGVSGFHLNGVPDRWSTWIRWCFTQRLWPSVMRRFKRSALALCWDGFFLSAFTFSHRFVIFCDIILALGSLDFKAHGAGRERGGGLFRYVFAFSVSGKSLWSRWNGETCCSSCWVVTPRNDIWMPWWRLNGWRLGNRIGFLQVER